MEVFRIEYDTPTGVFVSGQAVTGKVIVENRKPIKARFLKIIVAGAAQTGWVQSETHTRMTMHGKLESHTENVRYGGAVDYLCKSAILWKASDEEKCLPAGSHAFPFAFPIPTNCPPSLEGAHGSIRYYADVELDRPWKFNRKAKKYFTVRPIVDLNDSPKAISGWENSASKNTGLIFKKGLVSMTVHIPHGGYIPGEILPMTIDIENDSKSPVVAVRSKIKQHASYHASRGVHVRADTHSHHKYITKCVAESKKDLDIAPKSSARVVHSIAIPKVVTTFKCPVIEVYYTVYVTIVTKSTFGGKVKVGLSFIIGNIPLRKD